MAVPKRKVTPSRGGMRRSHDRFAKIAASTCDNCGLVKPAHHICPHCGFYKGKQVLKIKNSGEAQAEALKEETL